MPMPKYRTARALPSRMVAEINKAARNFVSLFTKEAEVIAYGVELDGDGDKWYKISYGTNYENTGYAFITKDKQVFGADESLVTFNELSEQTKQEYVKSGLGLDKAGGYGIQDGYGLVKEIKGSYYNIVGFPKEIFEGLLKEFGF